MARAVKEGWNSHYASLKGRSRDYPQKNYILRGQDTLYLQNLNVDGSDGTCLPISIAEHFAPETESSMVRKAYVETGSLNNSFVFKIPVNDNMPSRHALYPVRVQRPKIPRRHPAKADCDAYVKADCDNQH